MARSLAARGLEGRSRRRRIRLDYDWERCRWRSKEEEQQQQKTPSRQPLHLLPLPQKLHCQRIPAFTAQTHPMMRHTHGRRIAARRIPIPPPLALELLAENVARARQRRKNMRHEFRVGEVESRQFALRNGVPFLRDGLEQVPGVAEGAAGDVFR